MIDRSSFALPHLILSILAVFITVGLQIFFWPHITDDAFFTFRCAKNLMNGYGPVFNPPDHVEVFSNPLWMYLLAAGSWLTGLELPLLSKLLGLTFSAGTVWAILRFCRSYQLEDRITVGTLTLVWLTLTPGFQAYATLGLEVPLLTFLLTLGATQSALALQHNKPSGQILAALCFALAGVTRPEGPLYAGLWGLTLAVYWLWHSTNRSATLRQLVGLGILTTAPMIGYEIFRLAYFGQWVSNTALAKPPGVFGPVYFIMDLRQWILPLVACALLYYLSRPLSARAKTNIRPYAVAAGGPIIAGIVFYFYSGGDWMLFGRFLQPILPVGMLFLAILLDRPRPQPLSVWTGRTAFFLTLITVGALQQLIPYIQNTSLVSMVMRGQDISVIGQWIDETFPEPMFLVGRRTGAISYYAKSHTVGDLFGLTQYEQALYLRRVGTFTALEIVDNNPLLQKNPGLIMMTRGPDIEGTPRYGTEERAYFSGHYRCIRSFPQGNWGTYDMWLRSDLRPDIPEIDCLHPYAKP